MATGYSRQDLLAFLEYLADKGLMKKGTVDSRKAAVNTLLSVLSVEEAEDLRNLNVDELLHRFGNLRGTDFKPESMRVYRSRLTVVLRDFENYKKDPVRFRPQISTKERASKSPAQDERQPAREAPAKPTESLVTVVHAPPVKMNEIAFPIPIRKGVIVTVSGIPEDLTPEEATKIGNVVLALSGSQEG